MRLTCLRSMVALVALGVAAAPAEAGSYSFTPIAPPPGSTGNIPSGINNSGTIVGVGLAPGGGFPVESYLLSGGVYTPVNVPGSQTNTTEVQSINNLGQYVGSYLDSSSAMHGFTFVGGNYQTVDFPGAASGTAVTSLNGKGVGVGFGFDSSGNPQSFSLAGGNLTPLSFPNATSTTATSINDAGDVTGSYLDSNNNNHGFLLHKGKFTTLDDPLAAPGQSAGTGPATDTNTGQVVGTYVDANGINHGFVYQNGAFTTVDDPLGVGGTFIDAANDLGQLVGFYIDAAGVDVGFLATPTAAVPEPGSLVLLSVAGLTLAARRLRKRA
jgi:probable HAF family extracellular repeat protein